MLDGKGCQNILYIHYLLPRKACKADYFKETKRNKMKRGTLCKYIILDQVAHVRMCIIEPGSFFDETIHPEKDDKIVSAQVQVMY